MFELSIHDHSRQRRWVRVAKRFPSLATLGMAVEHFPRYINAQTWPHQVDVILFTCVLAGQGTHHVAGESVAMGPGVVGITLYEQEHDLQTDATGMEVVNVYLDLMRHPLPMIPAPWDRTLSALLPPHRRLVIPQDRPVHLMFETPSVLESALRWLLQEQACYANDQPHLLAAAMQRFLVELCRQTRRLDRYTPASGRQPDWLAKVQTLIDRDYAHPIGLADMVRLSRTTPEHLCRRFKQALGLSPMAYLTQRRIQAATWLLRTTGWQVSEIALRCGFNAPSHFNRQFKQAMHQSPTDYRRQHATTSNKKPAHPSQACEGSEICSKPSMMR